MSEMENESQKDSEALLQNENPRNDNAVPESPAKKKGLSLKIVSIAIVAVILVAGAAAFYFVSLAPGYRWLTSYQEARDLAKSTGKDVLFCFTGSDWDESSRKLLDVIREKGFIKSAREKYILCNFDIMRDIEAMAPDELEANFKLASKYGAQDFPYFVLLTSEGDVYGAGTFGMQDGEFPGDFSSEGLFAFFSSFDESRKEITTLKDAIRTAEGVEKARCIDAFLSVVYPSQSNEYTGMIRAVPDLDKNNETGLRGKYLLQIAFLDATAFQQKGLLNEAVACFTDIADDSAMTPSLKQEALLLASGFYSLDREASTEKILSMMEDAIAADPGNANVEGIRDAMESVKKMARD